MALIAPRLRARRAPTPASAAARLNYQLTGLVREHDGRRVAPSAAIMDTQSVKTSTTVPAATQGTDAAKKIVGP